MEGMQTGSGMGSTASAAQAAPSPSPNYVPPTPPTPAPATTEMALGGETSSSGGGFKEFFSDINVVDVVLSAFIVAGVIYSVYYNKYMMKLEKTGYQDVTDRVMKLESSIAAREAEMNAIGNANKRRKPLMRLA
jgi:hypothetical protein